MGKFGALVLLFVFAIQVHARVEVVTQYAPFSNFIYQLNCVSGAESSCSTKNYTALWNKNFIKSEPDREALKDWRTLMYRYDIRVDEIDLSRKLLFASFQSEKPEDYFQRLELLMTPTDASRTKKLVERFYPEFTRWWKSEGRKAGENFAKASAKVLKSEAVIKKLDQFEAFYEAELPTATPVKFIFFYRPDLEKEPTSGRQIEIYSIAEFRPNETPEQRLDVVIHELCHFFFQQSPKDKLAAFTSKFKSLEERSTLSLMNETLATVFGNGVINRHFMTEEAWRQFLETPNSFYYDYYIDKSAKSLLPALDRWLEDGKTIYTPGFFEAYTETLTKAFGKEILSPKLILNRMSLIADRGFQESWADQVRRTLKVSSMNQSEGSWSDPRLLESYKKSRGNALIIVHPKNLTQLEINKLLPSKAVRELRKALKRDGAVTYSHLPTPDSVIYVLSGNDSNLVNTELERLAKLKSGFEGVLARSPTP